jgi:predicted phosphodiesterase
MTRVAVLADIHGNAGALEAVLRATAAAGATRLIVLGDLVGYYYEPARVLDLLAPWPSTIIRGNHEDLLQMWLGADAASRDALRTRYGSGFAVCESGVQAGSLRWLQQLPHPLVLPIDGRRAILGHGHPGAIGTYVYPGNVERDLATEDVKGADIVWLAHTHYPMDATRSGVRVCNPGSVGQSRDGDPRASWALWEPATNRVEWLRTDYDREALLGEIARRDPDVPYLRAVLTRRT